MIPQSRNNIERIGVAVVYTLGLSAILLYTQAQPAAVAVALTISMVGLFVVSEYWLRNAIDPE